MSEDRWERLLGYLRRARARSTFDDEERAYRLEVASELRGVLELAGEGGPWRERLDNVLKGFFAGRRYDLTSARLRVWLREAATSEAFGDAVRLFLDPATDPVARVGAFAGAIEDEQRRLTIAPERPTIPDLERETFLAFASLLNFASAPEALPVVRPDLFNLLEQTLGYEWTFKISAVEQYERHLAFAEDVRSRLAGAGIEARDMIDTQSLIQIGGHEADFWALDPERHAGIGRGKPRAAVPDGSAYLSVCTVYRDAAADLREWIEFHRLVGVERFFLYDNFSVDNHLEVLAPYLESGIVSVRRWPLFDGLNGQFSANDDCLRWHRYDSRWIAFLDVDEFLFSPTGRSLPEVLADYEEWPAVTSAWVMFGFGGHRTRPAGLVVENYRRRIDVGDGPNYKSIVDPRRVGRCLSTHHFAYPHLSAVDEQLRPVDGPIARSPSFDRLRINHYYRKSEEEFVAKCKRKEAIGRPGRAPTDEELVRMRESEEREGAMDEAILTYLPALREALDRLVPA